MIFDPSMSVARLAEMQLETQLRGEIAEKLIRTYMEQVEERIRERVLEEVRKVTLGKVESIKSMLEMKELLVVEHTIDGDKRTTEIK